MKIEGLIEGESLVASARATAGAIDHQEMGGYAGDWSGDAQLFWMPHSVGARLTLTFPADAAGDKEIVGYFTRARDYGDITVSVNDRRLGTFSGYAAYVSASGAISLGRAPIRAGDNTMILEVTGKNAASTGYLAGLDGFLLQP